jgi:PAS domain S-box-containing protein
MFMPATSEALPCDTARAIVDASPDWITLLFMDARIRYLNRTGRRLVHYPAAGLPEPRRWLDLWPSAERDAAHGAFAVALAGGRGVFHAYCPALDGTPHWWEVSIWLVEEPAGTADGLIAVAHEVSVERRVLELERESRQSRFRGAESVTRHDILSALSVVKGEAQLLARRAERTQEPLRETCLRSIAAIGAAADRVQSLVDERMAAKQAH